MDEDIQQENIDDEIILRTDQWFGNKLQKPSDILDTESLSEKICKAVFECQKTELKMHQMDKIQSFAQQIVGHDFHRSNQQDAQVQVSFDKDNKLSNAQKYEKIFTGVITCLENTVSL